MNEKDEGMGQMPPDEEKVKLDQPIKKEIKKVRSALRKNDDEKYFGLKKSEEMIAEEFYGDEISMGPMRSSSESPDKEEPGSTKKENLDSESDDEMGFGEMYGGFYNKGGKYYNKDKESGEVKVNKEVEVVPSPGDSQESGDTAENFEDGHVEIDDAKIEEEKIYKKLDAPDLYEDFVDQDEEELLPVPSGTTPEDLGSFDEFIKKRNRAENYKKDTEFSEEYGAESEESISLPQETVESAFAIIKGPEDVSPEAPELYDDSEGETTEASREQDSADNLKETQEHKKASESEVTLAEFMENYGSKEKVGEVTGFISAEDTISFNNMITGDTDEIRKKGFEDLSKRHSNNSELVKFLSTLHKRNDLRTYVRNLYYAGKK